MTYSNSVKKIEEGNRFSYCVKECQCMVTKQNFSLNCKYPSEIAKFTGGEDERETCLLFVD